MTGPEERRTHHHEIVIDGTKTSPERFREVLAGYGGCTIDILDLRNLSADHNMAGLASIGSIEKLQLWRCACELTLLDGLDNAREVHISTRQVSDYPTERDTFVWLLRDNPPEILTPSGRSLRRLFIGASHLDVDVSQCPQLNWIDLPLCRRVRGLDDREYQWLGLYVNREEVLDDIIGVHTSVLDLKTFGISHIVLKWIIAHEGLSVAIDRFGYRENPMTTIDVEDCDFSSVRTLRVDGYLPTNLEFILQMGRLENATFGYVADEIKGIDLACLKRCRNLRNLDIGANYIEELDLSPLSDLEHLERIHLAVQISPDLKPIDVTPLLSLPSFVELDVDSTVRLVASTSSRGETRNGAFQVYDELGRIRYY